MESLRVTISMGQRSTHSLLIMVVDVRISSAEAVWHQVADLKLKVCARSRRVEQVARRGRSQNQGDQEEHECPPSAHKEHVHDL